MLKIVRVMAGADPNFEQHLEGVQAVFRKAFSFYPAYAEKIAEYAAGHFPKDCEVIILAAIDAKGAVIGFTVTFYFVDLKAAYVDYIASDPDRSARGIGGALYEMMRDDVRKRGARRLFLDALPDDPALNFHPGLIPDNKRRMAFYERLGARPIIGTAYEKTVTPANLGDPNMLLCDAMGDEKPMSRRFAKSVIERVISTKTGLGPDDEPLKGLLASIKDDPVKIRAPLYPAPPPRSYPSPATPIDIVITADEAPSIEHSPFRGYYERPARVSAIRRALEGAPLMLHRAENAGLAPIEAVHDKRMIAFLKETAEKIAPKRILYPEIFPLRHADRLPQNWEMRAGYFCIDTSTPLTSAVYPAARRSVDAAISGARLIEAGKSKLVYAVVRPPGHHAERRVFGGFCYFNNAAIAANHLSKKGKVAVLDIDHHHGNGTQDIFYERADVLTVSIHGHPESSYPFFAGFEDERGAGDGLGFNRNYPIKPGVDDAGYLSVLGRALRRIEKFAPAFLVVSFGADIMKGDPTGAFFVTADGMRRIGAEIGALKVPTLIVQEGGYNLANLRRGVRAFIFAAAGAKSA
ncbi:MAG TPA: histone deacetylase family protein [Parvularculaceae bacterium]|nr:histone deacetylase family protein [Parvularculaceae bacterium]